jgi:hypothetical protein
MTPANITSAVVAQPLLVVGTQNKNIISSDKHDPEARTLLHRKVQNDPKTPWRAGRP